MPPISIERVKFIQDRLRVLDACVKDLTRRQAFYYQALQVSPDQAAGSMREIKIEQLRLSVELSVLDGMLKEQQLLDAPKDLP
jgi:hypothetical protein